ncbi:anti-apoptotic protein NR13-like [Lethenteron reissneri]|nr:anti-apoptotic protein NR13-like [Lethenteron reissneri]
MRVELLQEALDTRGDALLAEFEASIPDFVRRAEELAKQVDPRRLVMTLAWQVLTAGPMSWGCVLSMVVFCALLVKNLRASGRLGDSEETWPLTDAVAAVLLTTRKTWLMEQGGWEGFLRAFGPGTPT